MDRGMCWARIRLRILPHRWNCYTFHDLRATSPCAYSPSTSCTIRKTSGCSQVRLQRAGTWCPTFVVVTTTAGLVAADPYVEPAFNRTTVFHGFNRVFSSQLTGDEIIAIPAALFVIGLASHHSYMQKTALFAGEAIFDSEVIREAMNSSTFRLRPSDVADQKIYSDTFFRSRIHSGSSFPSAHTITAVSIATVIARRYRKHHWVPWVAYGLAGTIAFSRLTLLAHFPSDVFVGGALGYAIARYGVLQDH